MALHLITGGSGSGKTYTVCQQIIREAGAHPELSYLILVPEQFTMETQKELIALHPGHAVLNIDVLSFQRLAYRIFHEVGGNPAPLLDDTGKSFVLQKIALQKKQELGFLGANLKKPGYISEMKSLISELIQYEISPEGMDQLLTCSRESPLLRKKLADVQVIYREFVRYMEQRYVTPEEVLDVLCRVLGRSQEMRRTVLVLDGFTGFTPIQYQLLEQLLVLCRQVWVTVTVDEACPVFDKHRTQELFYMSKEMIHRLVELARKQRVEIAESMHMDGKLRGRFTDSPALAFLEAQLFRPGAASYDGPPEEIEICAAAGPLDEMEQVVRRIRFLIRTQKLRYRDFAVITGDLSGYESYARQAFAREGIPCFIDRKQSVLMNPFVEYIRAALDMLIDSFSYESVFRYLRTGMSDIDRAETDLAENYVIAFGIRGLKQWSMPWERSYPGMPEGDAERAEAVRQKFLAEVLDFNEEFKHRERTVAARTQALYQFFVRMDIQQKLKERELEFARRGSADLAKEYAQIYGVVLEMLDKLVEVLGEERVTQKEYQQILEAGLSQLQMGSIPPTADQVLVGDVKRTRLTAVKALFFVGVNEGIIPQRNEGSGILTEAERQMLKRQDIVLAPTMREDIGIQRFYLYLMLTKPSAHLCLSYSTMKAGGESVAPAYLISVLEHLFPGLVRGEEDSYQQLESSAQAASLVVQGLSQAAGGKEDACWQELFSWYMRREESQAWMRQLVEAAFYENPRDHIGKVAAEALYGRTMKNSATRLERFAGCAFAHFLEYGLRLTRRARFEFRAVDLGNILHEALEQFAQEMKRQGYSWQTISREDTGRLLDACIEKLTGKYRDTVLGSSSRSAYTLRRCRRLLEQSIRALQEQLRHGSFEPSHFEVTFSAEESLGAAQVRLTEEAVMRLTGRIDRIDICETDRDCFVRIIDYKSGSQSLDLAQLYHGLQLQLLVYLNAALELEQREHPDKTVRPAGIFYFQIKDPLISGVWDEPQESIERELLQLQRMNGLANADPEVLHMLDRTLDGDKKKRSDVFSLSKNKDGSVSASSSVVSEEKFALLSRYVEDKIRSLGRQMLDGEAEASPYRMGQRKACSYCDFSGVCGFDQRIRGYAYRHLPQFSGEELWRRLEKEEEQ